MHPAIEKESEVVARTSEGQEIHGGVLRVTRHLVTFEIYNPGLVIQVSEVLTDFRVGFRKRTVYSGRAVVRALVPTNLVLICEATLDDQWFDPDLLAAGNQLQDLGEGFQRFVKEWQHAYKISSEFKVVVADLQSFLADMRLWLDQVEMEIRSAPDVDKGQLEHNVACELGAFISPALDHLFDRFEQVCRQVEPDLQSACRIFSRRQLHSLLSCSPFLYRTFYKPLGYAGDYEMVNMVIRDPLEGTSLFAKLLNLWFLQQAPAQAHRNRIQYLQERLQEVAVVAVREGRIARVTSLGCGPAGEIQRFLAESPLSNHVHFTLLDFNEETIAHTTATLGEIKRRHHRSTQIEVQKRSVNHVLKEASKSLERPRCSEYDFVYCAGLYDYLTDQVSRRVSTVLYDWTVPGGLFVATNVDVSNPRSRIMDFVMEWHLIYRDARDLKAVRPVGVAEDQVVVKSDITGVNLFLEVRKPERD